MIASVVAVARAGADLPVPVRSASPSTTAAEQAAVAPAAPMAGVRAAEASQRSSAEHGQQRQQQERANPQDVAATSRYVGELMAARMMGGAAPQGRPAHIAPERMAALVSWLENALPSEDAEAASSKQVDVKS